MAAVLSVTLTPCTRPTNCFAFSNTPEMLVPLGGLYSIVTANCPRSSTSRNRLGSRLMFFLLLLYSHPQLWEEWGAPRAGIGCPSSMILPSSVVLSPGMGTD